MNVQIEYEISLLNSNKVKGSITARIGQPLEDLKFKILQRQGLKNHASFICSSQDMEKITSYTQTIAFNQRSSSKKLSKISDRPLRKDSAQVLFEQSSMDFDNEAQQFVARSPQKPPIVRGSVRRSNRFFCCMTSTEYLQLRINSLNFYSSKGYDRIEKSVLVDNIFKLRSFRKKQIYFLSLQLTDSTIDFSFANCNLCKQWMGYLSQAMEFNNFLKEKRLFSKAESFQNYVKTLKEQISEQIVMLQETNQRLKTIHEEQPEEREVQQKNNKIITLGEFLLQYKIGSAKRQNRAYALKQLSKQKLLAKNQMKYAITQLKVLSICAECPYIIPLYFAFQTLQYLYLALKYVPTGDLSQQIRLKGQFSTDQAVVILAELVFALQFLHMHKIIYRDLKPENIMIDQKGHIYLVDFGLAKQLTTQDQLAQSFLGTPLYLAPQRFSGLGSINFKSDIYGVGCIFYEILHGQTAFKGTNYNSLVNKIKNDSPQYRKDLPPQFLSFLQQTLQKNPEKRLSHMSKHSIFKAVKWQQIRLRKHQGMKMEEVSLTNSIQITYKVDEDYNQQTYPKRVITGWQFNHESKNG